MKEIVFGLIPGLLFFYRYAPKFALGTVSGLFLMEVVPFLFISFIESIKLIQVLAGFFFLYSIYELGYIDNDVKAGVEKNGATIRNQFDRFNYKLFLLIRLPLITLALASFALKDVVASNLGVAAIAAMIPIFILHNRLESGLLRISTFLVLNNLKIVARILLLSPFLGHYFLSAIPHLFIKTLHYMNAKKLVAIEDKFIKAISFPVYIAFFCVFIFIDPWLIIVSSPYFINHTKSIIWRFFRNRFTSI